MNAGLERGGGVVVDTGGRSAGAGFSALPLAVFGGGLASHAQYRLQGGIADTASFALSLASLSDSLPSQGRLAGFWHNIDAIQAKRIAAIATAQHLVQFETFMMTPGQRAEDFAAALCERSRAGVTVQMLVDGLWREGPGPRLLADPAAGGGRGAVFSTLFLAGSLGIPADQPVAACDG